MRRKPRFYSTSSMSSAIWALDSVRKSEYARLQGRERRVRFSLRDSSVWASAVIEAQVAPDRGAGRLAAPWRLRPDAGIVVGRRKIWPSDAPHQAAESPGLHVTLYLPTWHVARFFF